MDEGLVLQIRRACSLEKEASAALRKYAKKAFVKEVVQPRVQEHARERRLSAIEGTRAGATAVPPRAMVKLARAFRGLSCGALHSKHPVGGALLALFS